MDHNGCVPKAKQRRPWTEIEQPGYHLLTLSPPSSKVCSYPQIDTTPNIIFRPNQQDEDSGSCAPIVCRLRPVIREVWAGIGRRRELIARRGAYFVESEGYKRQIQKERRPAGSAANSVAEERLFGALL